MFFRRFDHVFTLKFTNDKTNTSTISVFTQAPHAIHGVSHITVSKHHNILKVKKKKATFSNQNEFEYSLTLKRLETYEENSLLPCYAINPLNGKQIPIILKSDADFGTLNAQNVPYVDSLLGKSPFLLLTFRITKFSTSVQSGIPSLSQEDLNIAKGFNFAYDEILCDNDTLKNSAEVKASQLSLSNAVFK